MTWPSASTRRGGGGGGTEVLPRDDREFPTICSTGTEDYFGGAWNFDVKGDGYTRDSTLSGA